MTPEDRVRLRKELRYRVFKEFCEAAEGRSGPMVAVDFHEWNEKLNAPHGEVEAALSYLCDEGLVKRATFHSYQLTHDGQCEYEESLGHPEDGTEHFEPLVISTVINDFGSGNVFGSVQTGGQGNRATVTQTVNNTVTQNAIQQLRDEAAKLPPEKREEAESCIETIVELVGKPARAAAIKALLMTLGALYGYAAEHLTTWVGGVMQMLT